MPPASRACTRLASRPVQRQLEFRAGYEPSKFNLAVWQQNLESALAQVVGRVAPTECDSCQRAAGLYTTCVVVTGQLLDSCANCHYGSEGARCSFRHLIDPATATPAPVVPVPAIATPSRSRRQVAAAAAAAAAAPAPAAAPATPSKKRRRTTATPAASPAAAAAATTATASKKEKKKEKRKRKKKKVRKCVRDVKKSVAALELAMDSSSSEDSDEDDED
ncbi:uncharacterized protein EKO05_0010994 [Ascochyta rabiei]|uniref:uncharacterized protein n=1 Tax=Didymella rabiei TaxID=5454 RepID=UPI0021FCACF2|nr:uncharacterized protein EKO05_0010994 [Ascochyta rabiei]UPX20774.1 hypothetical protein EKO05_0010994 [Ascochyta rabiei]